MYSSNAASPSSKRARTSAEGSANEAAMVKRATLSADALSPNGRKMG